MTELFQWAPIMLSKLPTLPELQDVTGDLQAAAPRIDAEDRPRHRSGGSASRRRRSTTRSTTPSASGRSRRSSRQLDQHHVVLEVEPRFQEDAGRRCDRLYVRSGTAGQMVPLSALTGYAELGGARSRSTIRTSFPSVTLSFNLAPGHLARRRGRPRSGRMERSLAMPAALTAQLPGNRQGVPDLAGQPALPDRRRASSPSTSCSASCTRASSIRSRSSRPCPRPGSARSWR